MARTNFILYAIFCCFFLVSGYGGSATAAPDSVYTVEDVHIDVTAENAARAREKAFHQAQIAAFEKLMTQILSPAEMAVFQMPEADLISSLIKDFEVTDERLSSVRHIGTYTVRFNKAGVRDYLDRTGLAYSDIGRKPMLVLPYYQQGTRFVLWEENNPWRAAWQKNESFRGLAPVTVPIGDLQDVSDLSGSEPMSYDPAAIQRMAARYGADGVLIVLAVPTRDSQDPENPDGLNVAIYKTSSLRPVPAQRMTVIKASPEEDLFKKAALSAHKALEEAWKSQTIAGVDQANSLRVEVSFSSMDQWIETRRVLKNVAGVSTVELLSLTPERATLDLSFHGTEDRLRLALSQADMTLTMPRVNFGFGQGPAAGQDYISSPLIYKLYLNKYKPRGIGAGL